VRLLRRIRRIRRIRIVHISCTIVSSRTLYPTYYFKESQVRSYDVLRMDAVFENDSTERDVSGYKIKLFITEM